MRDTPEGIVEELRDQARFEAMEIGVNPDRMVVSEAADHIEYLRAHLKRIADGAAEPARLAAEALDTKLWLLTEKDSAAIPTPE